MYIEFKTLNLKLFNKVRRNPKPYLLKPIYRTSNPAFNHAYVHLQNLNLKPYQKSFSIVHKVSLPDLKSEMS